MNDRLGDFITICAATAKALYQLNFSGVNKKQQQKIQYSISSEKTMAFFGSSKPIIFRTGQSAALLQTTDRHMTGTTHQPNNDRDGQDVQPNRERPIGKQMGQGEAETFAYLEHPD